MGIENSMREVRKTSASKSQMATESYLSAVRKSKACESSTGIENCMREVRKTSASES